MTAPITPYPLRAIGSFYRDSGPDADEYVRLRGTGSLVIITEQVGQTESGEPIYLGWWPDDESDHILHSELRGVKALDD